MISASRVGFIRKAASRGRRCSVQSGMVDSRDETHGVDEGLPSVALASEDAAALGCQAVEPSPALSSFLHPSPLQPPTLFEPIQERIKRRDMELQLTGRARLD